MSQLLSKKKPRVVLRQCCVCRQKLDRKGMLRVVQTADGAYLFDRSQKAAGRGAYVCSPSCAQKARAQKAWSRAFKKTIGAQALLDLESSLEDAWISPAHNRGE